MEKVNTPTICVNMIVKNEQAMLARCLDSVKGADFIVISDTGSQDSTVEIAKRYTKHVYTEYKWEDSFAKARNFALSKVPKEADWVLQIDADEVLNEGIEALRGLLKGVGKEYSMVRIKLIDEKSGSSHMFQRVFRNDPAISWHGVAHNYLVDTKKRKQYDATELISINYGYSPAHKLDPDRTFRILSKAIKDNPQLIRERYYLAREYFYRNRWEETIKELDEYIKGSSFVSERNGAWLMRAKCLSKMGKFPEACDSAWQAIKYNANFKEALEFIASHIDPVNKERWASFAQLADNRGVLFVRENNKTRDYFVGGDNSFQPTLNVKDGLPMDLNKDGLFYIENLLQRKDNIDVLEWGIGFSTKHFTQLLDRAGVGFTWTGIEHNEAWYKKVKDWGLKNTKLILADKESREYLEPAGKYDIIYVDGRNRAICLQNAKSMLKEGGVVLLHDAQRERYRAGMAGYFGRYIGSEYPLLWQGTLEPIESIPQVIHQVWIGPEPAPTNWINTWKEKNPSFEHRLWTEKEIDKLKLDNRELYEKYYSMGEFASCSDIVRAQILRDFGGIYIDADMECITTIENTPFMVWDFVTIFAVDLDTRLNSIPLGAVKGHPILKKCVGEQGKIEELEPGYEKVGPGLLTKLVKDNDNILPAYSFAPVFHTGYKNKPTGLCYARHSWYSTPRPKKKLRSS